MVKQAHTFPLNEIETVYHDVVVWSNQYYIVPPFLPNTHPILKNHS